MSVAREPTVIPEKWRGRKTAAQAGRLQWQNFVAVLGDSPDSPGDYALCYPPTLMKSLAEHVLAACEQLGLRKSHELVSVQEPIVLAELINDAWRQFLRDSAAYVAWEQEQQANLHQFLQQP